MAETVAIFLAKAATAAIGGASASAAASAIVFNAVYYGTHIAIAVGASMAVNSLASSGQRQEANTTTVRQTIPPRRRAYGRCRLGGPFALWESKGRWAYDVVTLQEGRSEAIQHLWSHDHQVETILPNGQVVGVDGKYSGGGNDLIHVEWRLGLPTETAYPALVAALGSAGVWTANHRGDGVTSLGLNYQHGDLERFPRQYPNGASPEWSAVGLWTPVWDFRDEDQDQGDTDDQSADPVTDWGWTASSNLALQIFDHCRRSDGMAMDLERELLPALEHWKAEADICDEPIPLAGGGTEPRYHGSGVHDIPADPQDALDEMLAACDGRLLRDEHGVWRLWVGKVRTPTVWLDDTDVADFVIDTDAAAYDAVNEVVPTYVSEADNWSLVPAKRWIDAPDVALRGRKMGADLALPRVNAEGQARRITKRQVKMGLTPIRGTLTGLLSCTRAMGHRWIGLTLADAGLDEAVIEVQPGGKIAFSRLAVELPFALVPDGLDAWDPNSDEQPGETPAPPIPSEPLTTPEIISASLIHEDSGIRLALTIDGPDREDLIWRVRWRLTGSSSWSPLEEVTDLDAGPTVELETGFVPGATGLDIEASYRTGGGRTSDWSATFPVDTSAPPLGQLDFTRTANSGLFVFVG